MKKVLIAINVLCFVLVFWMLIWINSKNSDLQDENDIIQAEYDQFRAEYDRFSSEINENISEAMPLTFEEVETIQHNMDVLKEFYGVLDEHPAVIAQRLFNLKRKGDMESSWIVSIEEHTEPYTCIEIITLDGEHYWFGFEGETTFLVLILKGEDRGKLLYGVVE